MRAFGFGFANACTLSELEEVNLERPPGALLTLLITLLALPGLSPDRVLERPPRVALLALLTLLIALPGLLSVGF